MVKEKFSTASLARAGIIAALYVAVSFISAPIASGAIQVRLSEALCLIALLFPEACIALFVGCALSNLITGCAVYDVIFGSLITLVASILTYVLGRNIKSEKLKVFIGGVFPVVFNALILPLIWQWCYGFGEYVYALQALFLAVGQSISVYALGVPLYLLVKKILNETSRF